MNWMHYERDKNRSNIFRLIFFSAGLFYLLVRSLTPVIWMAQFCIRRNQTNEIGLQPQSSSNIWNSVKIRHFEAYLKRTEARVIALFSSSAAFKMTQRRGKLFSDTNKMPRAKILLFRNSIRLKPPKELIGMKYFTWNTLCNINTMELIRTHTSFKPLGLLNLHFWYFIFCLF